MSRNLDQTNCYFCQYDKMTLEEEPRLITEKEAGRYYNEYNNLIVANASCPKCEAKYLAWVDCLDKSKQWLCKSHHYDTHYGTMEYYDLSFRSTFNDEPGEKDYPKYLIEIKYERIGQFNYEQWEKENWR